MFEPDEIYVVNHDWQAKRMVIAIGALTEDFGRDAKTDANLIYLQIDPIIQGKRSLG